MPTVDILRRSPVAKSFRVEQVRGMFDVPPTSEIKQEWSVSVPIEGVDWKIGAIVGPSGSGKTTIARELFKGAHFHERSEWGDSSLLDAFPQGLKTSEIVEALSSVGLSSPPHWLKPFAHLSNGQQFRAELARAILGGDKLVVFDEFTSVVDRDVAKVCCAALSKTIRRRQEPQLVAVSCHFDILDWLQPDWVYDVGVGRFERRSLQRRPEIKLTVRAAGRAAWRIFRGHHYLSADISNAAQCFVATWNDKPVAFTSYIHFMHPRVKNAKRGHRTVVLPDFQGVGIGNALSEWLGAHLRARGFRFISTTSHPAMIRHRARSAKWRMTSKLRHVPAQGKTAQLGGNSCGRLTASFEYVG